MAEHQPTKWKLFCIVVGGNTSFSVKISPDETVDDLKKKIKKEKEHDFAGFDADRLTLYLVNLPDDDDLAKNVKQPLTIEPLTPLKKMTKQVEDLLPRGPTKERVHILVQTPDTRK
jgi:Crinkler effector protein N-terminal domain